MPDKLQALQVQSEQKVVEVWEFALSFPGNLRTGGRTGGRVGVGPAEPQQVPADAISPGRRCTGAEHFLQRRDALRGQGDFDEAEAVRQPGDCARLAPEGVIFLVEQEVKTARGAC